MLAGQFFVPSDALPCFVKTFVMLFIRLQGVKLEVKHGLERGFFFMLTLWQIPVKYVLPTFQST